MAFSAADPLARVLRLFTILLRVASRRPGQRIGRRDLAEACECSIETIKRDLRLLEYARVPLDYDKTQRTYTLPDKGWNLNTATLTRTEASAVALCLSLLSGSTAPRALTTRAASALTKITGGLPVTLQQQLQQFEALLRPGTPARDYSRAPVELMLEAARQQCTVQMLYDSRSSGTCAQRLVDPYRVDHREGRYWDMQAWCHVDRRVKTFALDRVQEARLTGETFAVQPWDDNDRGVMSGLRDKGWIGVEVRFDVVVALYARDRVWPFEAAWEEPGDGSLILRGQVRGAEGIVRELLSWRRHATVLGGPELRSRMAEEVRAMAALYTPDARERDEK